MARPKGIIKSEKVLGYKYTPEEANEIIQVLEQLKKEGMTTSKAILTVFREYMKKCT